MQKPNRTLLNEFILKWTVAQIPKYWVTLNGVIHIAWKKLT